MVGCGGDKTVTKRGLINRDTGRLSVIWRVAVPADVMLVI